MAYPFKQWPTWSELIDALAKLGVQFVEDDVVIDGRPFKARYFVNRMDNVSYRCPVAIEDGSQRLVPSMLRYVCTELHISPAVFGLDLG